MTPATAAAIADAIESAGHGIVTLISPVGPGAVIVNISAPRDTLYDRAADAIQSIDTLRVVRCYEVRNGFDYVCVRIATPGESK